LGKWSNAEIITAIRKGQRPDGRELAPIMPWRNYAALTDDDAKAVAAYLKSLKPVRNQVPAVTGDTEKAPGPYLTVVVP
jgi:cytochrome c553